MLLLLSAAAVAGAWDQARFKGILVFAVQKLRRVLVTRSMRYFSVYTVNLFFLCVCIHMNIMVSYFHYNKKLFPKYFFYKINVETMSLI